MAGINELLQRVQRLEALVGENVPVIEADSDERDSGAPVWNKQRPLILRHLRRVVQERDQARREAAEYRDALEQERERCERIAQDRDEWKQRHQDLHNAHTALRSQHEAPRTWPRLR